MTTASDRTLLVGVAALVAALAVSGWQPYDRLTWLMEVAPVLIVVPLLILTRASYPLTALLYALIFIHALILILGGAYTYARVPLGFWMQEVMALSRNPYDKIGHFAQGFIPAIAAREILLRGAFVHGRRMLAFLVLCVVLAIVAGWCVNMAGGSVWPAVFVHGRDHVWSRPSANMRCDVRARPAHDPGHRAGGGDRDLGGRGRQQMMRRNGPSYPSDGWFDRVGWASTLARVPF